MEETNSEIILQNTNLKIKHGSLAAINNLELKAYCAEETDK